MNSTHTIGILAEKIVAIRISLDGTVVPILRRREPNGRMADVAQPLIRTKQEFNCTEFVARVRPGDSGTAGIGPSFWRSTYFAAVIPLGTGYSVGPRELSIDGRYEESSHPSEIWFLFADGKLTWKSGHVSGEAVINETYPELAVVLRLPPGNQGEISFASPLFRTAAGEPASVLSVA